MKTIALFLITALLMSTSLSAQTGIQNTKVKKDTTQKEIIIKDAWSKKKKAPSKKKTYTTYNKSNKYNHETNIGFGNTKLVIKENRDTTIIGLGSHELIISENANKSRVRWNRKKHNNRRFIGHWTGFELGMVTFKENSSDFMELTYPKSSTVNINVLQYNIPLIGKRFGFVTGLGLSWYNFRFKEDVTMLETIGSDANNLLTYKKKFTTQANISDVYNTNEKIKKSKLSMSYITVPLLLEVQSANRHFYIAAGVIGGIKLGAHTKIKFNDGDKEKDFDDFYLRPYKADATLRFGVGAFKLWATYSLVPLFEDDKLYDNANDEFVNKTPISVGFSIAFN